MRHTLPVRSLVFAAASLAVAAVAAFLIASAAGRRGASGERAAAAFLVVQAVVLALGAPLLHSTLRREAPGGRAALGGLAFGVFFAAACVLLSRWASALDWGRLAGAQAVMFGFAALAWSLSAAATRCGAREPTAQVAATAVALAMVGNVFFANPLIEAFGAGGAKLAAVAITVWTNPWLAAAGSIIEADPLRSEALYRFSVIPYYAFRYPAASLGGVGLRAVLLAASYLACSGAIWAASLGCRRLRARHRV